MIMQLICRNANDYLDLYLLAKSLGDKAWENEIMDRLNQCYGDMVNEELSSVIQDLWKEYRKVSSSILDLYHLLQENPSDEKLKSKLDVLKHKQATLHRRIYMEERGFKPLSQSYSILFQSFKKQ